MGSRGRSGRQKILVPLRYSIPDRPAPGEALKPLLHPVRHHSSVLFLKDEHFVEEGHLFFIYNLNHLLVPKRRDRTENTKIIAQHNTTLKKEELRWSCYWLEEKLCNACLCARHH